MVMTLGAIEAPAQKDPRLLGHNVLRRAELIHRLVMHDRAVVALHRNPLPRQLIVGFVPRNAVADPLPVRLAGLRDRVLRKGVHSE